METVEYHFFFHLIQDITEKCQVKVQELHQEFMILWPEWSDDSSKVSDSTEGTFKDPQTINLPVSLKVHVWKRPNDVEKLKPTIYLPSSNPNLYVNNQHLLDNDFMRCFIASVTILNYYGKDGLVDDDDYPWNFHDKPWHGWLHIYSSTNTMSDGVQHNPIINTYGKYFVRLFSMGAWRRIEVDDLIPFDENGRTLLPQTENINELWPILLAKAMLKIASPNLTTKITDFHPITALTGWRCLMLDITHLSSNERWDLIVKYSPIIKESEVNLKKDLTSSKDTLKSPNKLKKRKKNSQITGKFKEQRNNHVLTLLSLRDIQNDSGIILNYPFYVESTCDSATDHTPIKPTHESWRRWYSPVLRQGIIKSSDYNVRTRRIFLFNPEDSEEMTSTWLDFNELAETSLIIFFFFNLKYFKQSIDISDIFHDSEVQVNKSRESSVKIERKKTKKQESRENNERKQLKYFYKAQRQCRNEPLYLLIDSTGWKFLLFNFSILPIGCEMSSLIIEKYCWFNGKQNLMDINTINTKSKALHLEVGRHLLRIFVQTENHYHLSVSSDTNFHVGDRRKIQKLMQTTTETLKILTSKIKHSMSAAFTSFGTDDYRENIKNYYKSYMPEKIHGNDKLYKSIHDLFRDKIIEYVKKNCSENYLQALRIFFLNPTIGGNVNQNYLSVQYNQQDVMNKSAVLIQSYWRMYQVKSYKNIHMKHDKYRIIEETLKNISNTLNEAALLPIVKSLIDDNEKLRIFYPFHEDFQRILQITEIKGMITIAKSHEWIPILRIQLNAPENATVFASLDLFIELPVYSLRVFDNDTGREIERIVHNVIPYRYQWRQKGFTVLAYGQSDDKSTGNREWSLHLTTVQGNPQFVVLNEEKSTPAVHELTNIYIPNVLNCIFRIIIKPARTCCVTLRASLSYTKVLMKLKLIKNDQVTAEVTGGPSVLLPIVHLDVNIENHWIIEGTVLNNSWPLTPIEWNVVMNVKKNRDFSKIIHEPWWRVQILSDNENDLQIIEDNSLSIELQRIKETIIINNPERLEGGRIARKKFLDENFNPQDFCHDENDGVRTLRPPGSLLKSTKINFDGFYEIDDEENRRIKIVTNEEMERNEWDRIAMDFEESQRRFIKQSRHLLQQLELNVAKSLKNKYTYTACEQ